MKGSNKMRKFGCIGFFEKIVSTDYVKNAYSNDSNLRDSWRIMIFSPLYVSTVVGKGRKASIADNYRQ